MSSPVKPSKFEAYVVRSSSPADLPDLKELFKKSPRKAPPLRSGSNAAAIPATARTTFASAADILREAPEIDIDTEQITYSPPRKPKPARKPRAKSQKAKDALGAGDDAGVVLSPKRFQSKSKTKTEIPFDDIPSAQPPLLKGRVTKKTATDKGKAKKKVETVSHHFANVPEDTAEKDPTDNGHSKTSLESQQPPEPALARRIDWTPPRANSAPIVLDSESDDKELLSSIEKAAASKDVFQNLFDEFAHKKREINEQGNQEASEASREVLKKRKRLELVSITDDKPEKQSKQSKETSPVKPPTAKKKARTITELATAPYAPPEFTDVDLLAPGTKDSLLRYFDTDGQVTALVEHQSIAMDRNSDKPKKKPAKPRKKKGATIEDPILLSPSSALKQSTAQDFLFGTSSQLMLEDSPRTLRNLQAAIKASMQDDPFAQDDPFGSSPPQAAKRTGLWHAGARGTDGDLLEAETIELIGDRVEAATAVIQTESVGKNDAKGDFIDIGDVLSSPPQTVNAPTNPKSHFWQYQKKADGIAEITSANTSEPPSSTQEPSTSKETDDALTPRPKYELFTDAQLAKQINTFGFKPVKRRQAMIALLNQCWVDQHPGASLASSTLGAPASISTSAVRNNPRKQDSAASVAEAETMKKPRGRPKKDKSIVSVEPQVVSPKRGRGRPRKVSVDGNGATNLEEATASPRRKKSSKKEKEIADSENDDLSLSPHSRPESVFSSPPPMDLSLMEEGETSLNLDPTEQEADMFAHITKAVTSAPRSRDPDEPSWHEKMLMYDPVVLEELTAWLNSGQLTRVGYDGEASPAEVKKWCESKSIICLWKENTRGKERKRY
ncbi:hypothetical protein PFICI_02512 [Pestalotiopsis fici W106-1]|uniref:Structure-specific endonuclease subunit SLX4 n=1 Tax=Pestalotiopsis fici (strain W106-1 / CGMCC3.15140) TaxID=1229662 RepID=W3XGC7_PESFW|nr:uncharacterized protein PFICI_02512 [Pestalotiopsis fici W106-1]ETS84487.1 hypothetical protein PFICI_02512 [Pestalotiopsis fici W106-1]